MTGDGQNVRVVGWGRKRRKESRSAAERARELRDLVAEVKSGDERSASKDTATKSASSASKSQIGVSSAKQNVSSAKQSSTSASQVTYGGRAPGVGRLTAEGLGPQPRGSMYRTPKQRVALALRGALSERARDSRVHVISSLVEDETPSAPAAVAAIRAITASEKVLVVLARDEDAARQSLSNVESAHVILADQLNAYDVLTNDDVVFTSAGLKAYVAGPVKAESTNVESRRRE